jgi:hypothetical protein
MTHDPIVTEVRQAGQALAEQAGGDLHTFFERLRKAQEQYSDRLGQPPTRQSEAVQARTQHGDAHEA